MSVQSIASDNVNAEQIKSVSNITLNLFRIFNI